jgi:hypothetical protein
VDEIERRRKKNARNKLNLAAAFEDNYLLSFIDTLEVIDPYAKIVQYSSVKDGIQAHAEDYSFNIESELFNQLTKEQQALWRKEIEEACISGGYAGYQLAKDPRYKENLEVKEVDLEKHLKEDIEDVFFDLNGVAVKGATHYLTVEDIKDIAKHFFELGLNAQCKISHVPNIDDSLEELGVDPTSKEAKIFKESYYIALEKLKAQNGE